MYDFAFTLFIVGFYLSAVRTANRTIRRLICPGFEAWCRIVSNKLFRGESLQYYEIL